MLVGVRGKKQYRLNTRSDHDKCHEKNKARKNKTILSREDREGLTKVMIC